MTNTANTVPDDQIRYPEKLWRLASLSRAMLEEARSTPCDTAGCDRLRRIYEKTLSELGGVLPPALRNELAFMSVTFEEVSPSPSEIRVAQAELVGWLEGLLNGIAASALVSRARASGESGDNRPGQYL